MIYNPCDTPYLYECEKKMPGTFEKAKQISAATVALVAITTFTAVAGFAKSASIVNHLPATPAASNDFSFVTIAKPGERFDVKQTVVKGKYTVVDFQSKYCPDCLKMKPMLKTLSTLRPDMAVRLVDINRPGFKGIDWKSPVALQYKIHDIPQFKLFGPNGALICQDEAAMKQIEACLAKDLPLAKK